ncbi:hypothetical protein CHARACLAT_027243 [Characodon lateralis]|uniref:Uncharacterized protein n=1 Tax=Characodon lateralis TaxID=208331 RepID=A0ABU7DK94_9TELE|nr:hypothetical protein [Characodon lateralis]
MYNRANNLESSPGYDEAEIRVIFQIYIHKSLPQNDKKTLSHDTLSFVMRLEGLLAITLKGKTKSGVPDSAHTQTSTRHVQAELNVYDCVCRKHLHMELLHM